MMYWGTFVLAVLTASLLEQSYGEDFQCPVCRGRGKDPKKDCDRQIVNETCTQLNPICVSTLYSYGTFVRLCSDKYTYERSLRYCERMRNCKKVMCTESKCKAEFPFECPYCESYESLEDCDKNLETQKCRQGETTCFVRYRGEYPGTGFFMRGCMDQKTANGIAPDCTQGNYEGVCQFGTCKKSGCLASFQG